MMIAGGFASAVIEMCRVLGLSCRCLYGAVRQQCAGHLPFERQARANGGFSILPTGSTDPERSLRLPQSCRSGTQGFHEFRCSEAAVRDLTHPAISSGPSHSNDMHFLKIFRKIVHVP